MKIVLDRSKCVGLGLCESFSPDHFEVQDDGTLLILKEVPDDDNLTEVRKAVGSCPTSALSLVD
ncbi:MAG: ferredoxin [Actinomycetota bacterium]